MDTEGGEIGGARADVGARQWRHKRYNGEQKKEGSAWPATDQ